jgi:lysophospholipase L1-like esterase
LGSISFATGDGQHPTAQGHQTIYSDALPYFDPIIAPTPLRVCPMGDSIAAGYTDNPGWTVPFQFGYRSGLYTLLTNGDVSFQYVGSSPEPWNGVSGTPTNTPNPDLRAVGQDHHEGYTGQGTAFVLSHIGGWITNDQPDVILLQIGINDIGQGSTTEPTAVEANLSNIVATAVSISPTVHLVVGQITPYSGYTVAITKYNNYIANVLIPYFSGQGYLVCTVNQYTNLCFPGTTNIDASLFANGINHPNALAYNRMAQTWIAGLQQYYYFAVKPSVTVAVDTEPATASAFVGEPITFTASFTSSQPMTYQWQVISGGATNIILGATNATLTITNVQVTNSGAYYLQASNSLGVAASAPGSLTVSTLPAAVNNVITATAAETGRGIGTFEPGWVVITNNSLIAGQVPGSAVGNFSEEATGRSVNALTAGGDAGLTKIVGPYGGTSSTNYVTCGNGTGPDGSSAGSSIIYNLTNSTATNGYNLTNITVYGGWADNGRDQQAYAVYYSTVLAPTNFLSVATVSFQPSIGGGIQSATRVSLLSATGQLAANVAAIKFDFTNPGSENGYCGYQQIALFGTPATSIVTNPPSPQSAIIKTPQFSASWSAFDGAITNNLIRAGQNSLGSVTTSHAPSNPSTFPTAGLNDGSAVAYSNYTYYATINEGGLLPVTITFNLNTNSATGGAPAGYVVTAIQVLTGWKDSNLANQSFQLLLSLNGGPFNSYGSFISTTNTTSSNGGNNSILQTLNGRSGPIASGITGVQFVFSSPGGSQGGDGGTLIRELQVFGVPVVNLAMQPISGNQFQLAWPQGVLVEATNIMGPWVTNPAASPYTVTPTEPQKFYRVQL